MPATRKPAQWLGVFVRGMAMGIAEVVPGVSGGTIAFVTGIYLELVGSFARFGAKSITVLLKVGPVRFWQEHNLSFLALLGLGMVVSVGLFARLISGWIEEAPPIVWGFFLGLITATVVHIGGSRSVRLLVTWGTAGLLIGSFMLLLDPLARQDSLWVFFLGGLIAACAWLLPAVSGSFLLLILGLYTPVLDAINELNFTVLIVLGSGCAVGLLGFSKGLYWLMTRHRETVLALLTGFIAGSLPRLWPWSVDGQFLSPEAYEILAAESAFFPWVGVSVLAGIGSLWLLSRFE